MKQMQVENKTSFFDRLRDKVSGDDLIKIRGAYYLSKFGHRAQLRKEQDANGNPLRYFEHPRRVAIILMDELDIYDPDYICAALLHDTLEDTDAVDVDVIKHFFGHWVARYVSELTKTEQNKETYYEAFTTTNAYGSFVIKICDRIDNLRSLHQTDPEFQLKQIMETKDVFIPQVLEKWAAAGRRWEESLKSILLNALVDATTSLMIKTNK